MSKFLSWHRATLTLLMQLKLTDKNYIIVTCIAIFQCTRHQPISVADVGWCWNNVKPLVSSCIQNVFKILLCWRGAANQTSPPGCCSIPASYGIRRVISAFRRIGHLSLPRAKSIQSTPSEAISSRSILIFNSSIRPAPCALFPLGFSTKIVYALRLFVRHEPLLSLFLIWPSGYTVGLSVTVVLLWAPSFCAVCNVRSISQVSSKKKLHSGVDCARVFPLRRALLVLGRFLVRFTSGTITKFCAAVQVMGYCNRVDFVCADVVVLSFRAGRYHVVSL